MGLIGSEGQRMSSFSEKGVMFGSRTIDMPFEECRRLLQAHGFGQLWDADDDMPSIAMSIESAGSGSSDRVKIFLLSKDDVVTLRSKNAVDREQAVLLLTRNAIRAKLSPVGDRTKVSSGWELSLLPGRFDSRRSALFNFMI